MNSEEAEVALEEYARRMARKREALVRKLLRRKAKSGNPAVRAAARKLLEK